MYDMLNVGNLSASNVLVKGKLSFLPEQHYDLLNVGNLSAANVVVEGLDKEHLIWLPLINFSGLINNIFSI